LKVIYIVLAIVLLAPGSTFGKWKIFRLPPLPHIHKTKQEPPSTQTKQETPPPETQEEEPASASASTTAATAAQDNTAAPPSAPSFEDTTGPTAYVQLQGGGYPKSIVSSVDINLGYNLTDHLGADIGLPIFYVRSPLTLVLGSDWKTSTLMGEPYIDVHYKLSRVGVHLTTVLTGTVPASSPERIFTTGRAGVDWFNHIEPAKSLGRITPFLNFGAANSTVNRYYMPRPYSIGRPYQTLGLIGDGEVGLSGKLPFGIVIGASAYGLLPSGQQKIFSRLVTPGSTVVGEFTDNRYYFSAFETTGPASIARDSGYSGWVEYNKVRNFSLQVGYTHSNHYRYDMITLMLNFDGTELIRTITGKTE